MIREAIIKLAAKKDLSLNEAGGAFEDIFSGQATPAQTAAFLTALSFKGETYEEIAAAARAIRDHACKIQVKRDLAGIEDRDEVIFDTCGTGGGGVAKFNISTAAAFVVAAAGVKVAKHGNRAMSSKSGSADCLEALGVDIAASQDVMQEAVKKIGIGFLYAPLYHPALKAIAAIRREIGIKTIFNIAGPLSNPAQATHQLLGVYDKRLLPIVAGALRLLGTRRALVVYSDDLKDEVSLSGPTYAMFLDNKKIKPMRIVPGAFGLKKIRLSELRSSGPKESAQMTKQALSGKSGAMRSIVIANSACALFVAGKTKTLKEGAKLAAGLIDDGSAKAKLAQLIDFTRGSNA